MPEQSPVDAARMAGYSDDEINSYLAPRMAQARALGYSQDEINNHLGIKAPPAFDTTPEVSRIQTNLDAAPKPVTSFADALDAGWQISTTGLVARGAAPTKVLAEDAPMYSRIAAQAAELAGDVPAMLGGFVLGAGAGAETGPGAAITGTAGAMALPTALRETLMDSYTKGQFTNFSDFWDRMAPVFIHTAKSYVTGAATGAAGSAVPVVLDGTVSPAVMAATKTAAEVATMTTVGKGLEGQVPSAQDFVDAAITLGGLKFAGMGAAKLRDLYAKAGVPPAAVVADARNDVTVQQDLLSDKPIPGLYEKGEEAPTKPSATEGEDAPGSTATRGANIPSAQTTETPLAADNGASPEPSRVAGTEPEGEPPPLSDAEKTILSHVSIGEAPPERPWTWGRLYTNLVDKLYPIGAAVREATGGEELPASEDAYKLARLMSGVTGKADQMLNGAGTFDFNTYENNGPSLKAILAPVADNLDGLRAYIASRHALELEARDIRTGFDLDAAREVVDAGSEKYGPVADALHDFSDKTLQYVRDSGIVSGRSYDAIRELVHSYVPFQRVVEQLQGTEIRGAGSSLQARNPVFGQTGSLRTVIDPLESIIRNTYLFTEMAERNAVGTKLVDLLTANDEAASRTLEPPTDDEIDTLRSLGVSDADSLRDIIASLKPPKPDEIRVFRDGKAENYQVDPELARAMKGLDAQSMDDIWRLLQPFSRTLRAGAVLQPDFMLRHTIRDFLYAFTTFPNGFFTPLDMVRGFIGLGARGEGPIATTIRNFVGVKPEDFDQWQRSGASQVSMVSLDRQYLQTSLDQLTGTGLLERAWNVVENPNASVLAKARAVGMTLPMDVARKFLLNPLQIGVQFAETASHLGAFIKAKNQMAPEGEPLTKAQIQQAGYISRDTAVDAARMGAKMRVWNAVSAFANIAVQDGDRVVRAFANNPMATAIKVAGAISLPSALVWWSGHDDPRYRDAPNWERDLFWVIPTDHWVNAAPGDAAGRPSELVRVVDGQTQVNNGIMIRIPKPWGMGLVFGSGVERLLDGFHTANPDAFKDFTKSMAQVSIPNLLPNAVVPIIEQFANRTIFTNRTLVPSQMEGWLPEYQYTPYTTETTKALGQLLGAFPGISAAKTDQGSGPLGGVARALSSPILLENYLRGWTGNFGTYALELADLGLRKAGMVPDPPLPARTLADIPFVRAFVVRYPTSGTQPIQDFEDAYDQNKVYFDTWTAMARQGNVDAAAKVQAAGGPLMLVQLGAMRKAITEQSQIIRDVYKNPDIPPDEKRQLIDTAYWRMSELAQLGNAAFAQAKQAALAR